MAGVAGRSGGGNRTISKSTSLREANKPQNLKKPKMSGYLTGKENFTVTEIYNKLADKLFKLGLTEELDGHTLTMLAQQYHFLQECNKVYQEEGIKGKIVQVPVFRAITDAQKEVRILLSEWYLTPSTRGKRPNKPGSDDNNIDDLLNFTH